MSAKHRPVSPMYFILLLLQMMTYITLRLVHVNSFDGVLTLGCGWSEKYIRSAGAAESGARSDAELR